MLYLNLHTQFVTAGRKVLAIPVAVYSDTDGEKDMQGMMALVAVKSFTFN